MPKIWEYLGSELRPDGWVALLIAPPDEEPTAWDTDSLKLAVSNRGKYGDFDGALPVLHEALEDLTGPRRKQVEDT